MCNDQHRAYRRPIFSGLSQWLAQPLVQTQLFARTLVCGLAMLTLAMQNAEALTIHYEPDRSSVLVSCDEHTYVGERDQATACYRQLLVNENALVRADAATALGDVRVANKHYREAAANSDNPAIKTRWGQLYLSTHQISDAVALFREALVYDQSYLPAQLGLLQAQIGSFSSRARQSIAKLLLEQGENVQVLVLMAKAELQLQHVATARVFLDKALGIAEEQNIPALEIFALHAGANLLEAKPIEEWADKALAINPLYGDVFAIAAHYYIITYRYREAVELYQRAVNTDPELATAHRDLGINFLRINNIFAARHYVRKAFELDPYDALTVNTLRLLDDLDDMRISRIDVSDMSDADNIIGRAIIRLNREDVDALEPYVQDLVARAVQTFTDRYDFSLQKPVIVELYHDHDDFGVRTVSTPGIGLLGVTFGYVLAMDSPKARASGEFHWGSTLWHELAHVFTIEATNHLLPRWFSEGLSVYEEWNTGPMRNRELSVDVLNAIQADKLLSIDDLDQGFVHPNYPGQVQVSYMQAGLACDFISRRWGHSALVSMLKSFADKADTSTALLAAIGVDGAAFDELFDTYLDAMYGDLLASLEAYRAAENQIQLATDAEDWNSVEALARDLIRRYPERVGGGNGYEVLAEVQRKQDQHSAAIDTLMSWYKFGGHHPETLQRLARDLRDDGRLAESAAVLESLNWVMPYMVDEHGWLGDFYLSAQRPAQAIREFSALLGLRHEDPALAYLGIARASLQLGNRGSAKRQVLQSLENAPFYRPAQRLLLELNSGEHVD